MRTLLAGFALLTGACSPSTLPLSLFRSSAITNDCHTDVARISFDFEAASFSRCSIDGEREFSILVTPEHYPPINPSPWYAFRYEAKGSGDIVVNLRYLGGSHRYRPIWSDGSEEKVLDAEISEDGKVARLSLPEGAAYVSAQELVQSRNYRRLFAQLGKSRNVKREVIGRSHDGRKIEALRMGDPTAPRLIVLLGRQHPPEVTGAVAMKAFLEEIAVLFNEDEDFGTSYQVLAVPLLNPDGVARGNWRANLGGKDLNRDWGDFTQPETRAVKRLLSTMAPSVKPVLMVDFHSTHRNLFYVQGEEETSETQERFLSAWLGDKEEAFSGYSFSIERRNANPGSGTTKNWFHQTYGIPAYTYEVGDQTEGASTEFAARELARSLKQALPTLAE